MVTAALLSAGTRVGLGYPSAGRAIYVAVGVVAVLAWGAGRSIQREGITPQRMVLIVGTLAALAVTSIFGLSLGRSAALFWPVVSVLTGLVLTATVWVSLARWQPAITRRTGISGGLLLTGQTLDATTTMVGIDVLGFSEQVTLSRLIIDATAGLPITPLIGTTGPFVAVKVGLAIAVLCWIGRPEDFTEVERRMIFGIVTAVGVIPAVNNLVLQTVV